MVRAMRNRLDRGEVAWNEMAHVMGWITFEDYIRYCDASPYLSKVVASALESGCANFSKSRKRSGWMLAEETAKRHEVSISSVARAENHYHSMLSYAVATAKKQGLDKT